jgi:hypothetical protein
VVKPWRKRTPGGSSSLHRSIYPLGEMCWWVKTNHLLVHYAQRTLWRAVGKQMMRKGVGTVYRIVVRSELSNRYAVAFEGMEMETKNGDTILTGEVIDQPHLYGILDRINGLGLKLLSVQALPEDAHPSAERKRES